MCAIHGFIDHSLSEIQGNNVILSMLHASHHRGPDFQNYYRDKATLLGHNRLSIIDLKSISNQPMIRDNYSISFNGEIYNYIEIRKELIEQGFVFQTDSDTEVILYAYMFWGKDCVSRFLGMWAFVIWDSNKHELFGSRDRFGIKPFYYIQKQNKFYFSSEIKALRKSPIFSNDLNFNQVNRALKMGWITFGEETVFSEIQALPPGSNFTLVNGNLTIQTYWKIQNIESEPLSNDEYVSQFKELFNNSMDLHLRSDVPIAATLSGGIDSSSIVCDILKNKKSSNLNTYSIYYTGENAVDERPFIEEIKKKYPSQFTTHFYSPSEGEVEAVLHDVMYHCDFPMLGSSPISQYFIMQRIAKDGVKVVLSGQGADDYLGGYNHAYYRLYADMLRNGQLFNLSKSLIQHKKDQQLSIGRMIPIVAKSLLSTWMNETKLYTFEQNNYFPQILKKGLASSSLDFGKLQFDNRFNSFHEVLMKYSSLPSLLHYEDRNSMAASIESRVPFLDHRLVELGFQMPNNVKIKNSESKWVLRESMKDLLPQAIRYRKDKKGFVTPGEVVWLRNSLKHLLEIDYKHLDFLDKEKTQKEIDTFLKGNNANASFIWRIASLNYWIKNFN